MERTKSVWTVNILSRTKVAEGCECEGSLRWYSQQKADKKRKIQRCSVCESSSSAKSRLLTSFDDVRPTNQGAIIGFSQLVSRSSKLCSNDWENLKIVVRPGDYDVYSDRDDEKVGTVKNIWVDESGRFGYLVVDTGFWIFGKQVLLPVDRTRIDQGDRSYGWTVVWAGQGGGSRCRKNDQTRVRSPRA